jgi:NADH-quinone oxidoreductase subunit L
MESGTFFGLPLLVWIPLLPLLGALINLTLGSRLSKRSVSVIAVGSVAAAFAVVAYLVFVGLFAPEDNGTQAWQVGGYTDHVFTWIKVDNLTVDMSFHLDTLSAVMCIIVTFVGSLIHVYSTGYMADDPGYARFFGYLNLFTGAMLVLVLGASLPVMFIGWEGVGLCSFLLISFWYDNDAYATAGRKAFVVNRIGDFCFLLGMFLLFWATKTLDFEQLKNATTVGPELAQGFWGGERLAAAAGILLFIGACGKSAQLPLFVWLPDAMAGPTPVSALIHAATMVTAGVYMVCRLSFLYTVSTTAMIVVSTVGLLTALAAAFMAFAQTDLKKVLAYSTVSQLGFMFVAAGTGNWLAAIFHLGTHAFFKACLFLGAGSVMHAMHHGGAHDAVTQGDITKMGGLRKHMPITRATFAISCLAISGIFPFSGFFSKDEILAGAWGVHPPDWPEWYGHVLWFGLLVAALGTAFYMWRLYFMVFAGDERSDYAKHAHESPWSMTSVLVVLAFFATVIGLIGLPHLEEVHLPSAVHALSSWLAPSEAAVWYQPGKAAGSPIHAELRDATTLALMGGALLVAVLGIALAWMFYGRGPSPSLDKLTEGPLAGAYDASKHKLWFDEIYDAIIVRPFRVVARGLYEIVDRFIIDTVAVSGVAFVVGLFGRLSRWIQNGQVQRYLAGLAVGAAAVFLVSECRRKPSFEYTITGEQLKLHAEPGAGVVGQATTLHWHLDGSTDCAADRGRPSDPPDLVRRLGDVGAQVTLCIEDRINHDTRVVTRTIEEEQP